MIDEIGEDGRLRIASSRSWPHAEALKALAEEAARGEERHARAIPAILTRLSDLYCPADLNGGWVDHVDADDLPISKVMPASTLYHLYFGITAAAEFSGKAG